MKIEEKTQSYISKIESGYKTKLDTLFFLCYCSLEESPGNKGLAMSKENQRPGSKRGRIWLAEEKRKGG
jgi:hypothetical protein